MSNKVSLQSVSWQLFAWLVVPASFAHYMYDFSPTQAAPIMPLV